MAFNGGLWMCVCVAVLGLKDETWGMYTYSQITIKDWWCLICRKFAELFTSVSFWHPFYVYREFWRETHKTVIHKHSYTPNMPLLGDEPQNPSQSFSTTISIDAIPLLLRVIQPIYYLMSNTIKNSAVVSYYYTWKLWIEINWQCGERAKFRTTKNV